jgi:acetyl esterase/lipase
MSAQPGARLLRAGLIEALTTLDVYKPFSRKGPLSPLVFFSSWPVSELPIQTAFAEVALAAGLVRPQDLRSRRGQLGLALTAASVAGLVGVRRAADRVEGELELALVDALGPHYREEIRRPTWPLEQPDQVKRPGAARSLLIRRQFAHGKDISYGPHGKHNLLDVWRHEDLPNDAKSPVVLQVPGGAWVTGNKQNQAYPLMSHLAERGWVCVAMSYRLSPRATWPEFLVDVKRAIAWIRANIAEHGGDPDYIAITGGSAGGHLSALASLTANDPAYQPGFEEVDTSVKAAVPLYGVYDWVDEARTGHSGLQRMLERLVVKAKFADDPAPYRAASPLYQVRPDAPPTFLLHGTNDSLVPIEQGRAFAKRLREVSTSPVAFVELPLAQHAFDFFGSVRAAATAQAIERFLGVIYGRDLAAGHGRAKALESGGVGPALLE